MVWGQAPGPGWKRVTSEPPTAERRVVGGWRVWSEPRSLGEAGGIGGGGHVASAAVRRAVREAFRGHHSQPTCRARHASGALGRPDPVARWVPKLLSGGGLIGFLQDRGFKIPSPALLGRS